MKRTVTCTVVGIIALLCLWVSVPNAHYVPHGVILPAKVVRAAIPVDGVTLYQTMPPGAQDFGKIRVEYAFQTFNEATRDELIATVKSLAASVGANGVVMTLLTPSEGVRPVLVFVGTAVTVPGSVKQ